MLAPEALVRAAARGLRADPLANARCSSVAQRELYALCSDAEVYWRSGNQSGKTRGGATLGIALARGLHELDGRLIGEVGARQPVRLPQLTTPNVGLLIVPGYKQSVDSAIAAYREMLGAWPHHLAYVSSGAGTVGTFYVKPERSTSDDFKDWSRIVVFVDDGKPPLGIRADWAHADEPPSEATWREIRFRGRANRPFIRFITATPLERRDWEWLRADYATPQLGKREIRSTVHDNLALSLDHLAGLEREAANDPLARARLLGEYVDTSGLCPFDYAGLERWRERCEPGMRWKDDPRLELWGEIEQAESYLVLLDPSAGIRDPKGLHDPCGMLVVARRKARVVGRLHDYLPAFELGALARKVAERWNRGLVVPEMNGGYGEAVLLGLSNYPNVYFEEHHDSTTGMSGTRRLGWRTTSVSRGTLIDALQRAVREDSIDVPSLALVENLMAVTADEHGRIAAVPGRHDEDMILAGIAAHLLETLPVRIHRAIPEPIPSMRQTIYRSLGRTPTRGVPEVLDALD